MSLDVHQDKLPAEAAVTPRVKSFFDEATFTATHVVIDPETRHAAVIDPVLDYDPKSGRTDTASADEVIAFVTAEDLVIDWLLETHVHADHLTAAPYLQEKLGGRVAIGAQVRVVQETFKKVFNAEAAFATDGSQFDHLLADGETFAIGHLQGRVIATPGHTPACSTYLIGDAAFVGDTLFMPDFGTARCDFPGGDARQLYGSIQKILGLPPATRLFLCHDYKAPGRDHYAWETTVAAERAKTSTSMKGSTRRASCACARRGTRSSTCRSSSCPRCRSTCGPGKGRRRRTTGSVT